MAAENKPEGLKRIRNPGGMPRSPLCYAGHGPAKGGGDDADANTDSRIRGDLIGGSVRDPARLLPSSR
ncbi:hypothetical protein ANANG_G00229060 [Anguilla anguilla]|uniref:Uncharacterized protein n=1 Tax=Anguilla anguilla TaxID=7936 RepID=A0A9D3LZ02_ANGAN|nr:hypothetical protein ANANG_G00229060 [Anguilla anguilla]